MNKTTTRTGLVIGRSYSSTLHPEEAVPLDIPKPQRFDAADRAVIFVCVLALLALAWILLEEAAKVRG